MNPHREQMLKDREQQDPELFEKIKANPKPDIYDLCALFEERFIEWRKLHDFPVLLNHFDKTLILFKEWKSEKKLTNEITINCGTIAPFLEYKNYRRTNPLFNQADRRWEKERTIVPHKKHG